MEKNMENEMETGVKGVYIGVIYGCRGPLGFPHFVGQSMCPLLFLLAQGRLFFVRPQYIYPIMI